MNGELSMALENAGLTIEQLNDMITVISDALREAWETVKKFIEKVIAGLFSAITAHPKWYRLYKHAKKKRTRKKYQKLLLHEVFAGDWLRQPKEQP